MIILFSKKGEFITEILSSKIFVFFGIISYSLYLWHYPIFAFLRYIDIFNNSIWIKLLSILLTIILSIFSYYLIERPFRNKNIISIKTLTTYILVSVIILLSYSFYILKTEGLSIERIKNKFPTIIFEKLEKIDINKKDLVSINGRSGDIFIIGDSYAGTLKYHLNIQLKKIFYNFYSFKEDGFFFIWDDNFHCNINYKYKKLCLNVHNQNKNFLQTHKDLIVIWNQNWLLNLYNLEPINVEFLSKERKQEYFLKNIVLTGQSILKQGHTLILIYPTPSHNFSVVKLMKKKIFFDYFYHNNTNTPIFSSDYEVYKKKYKIMFDILDTIQGPNVYRVYPHKSFCNTVIMNRCVANNENHLFYYDNIHLSLEGSKYIVNDIMKTIKQIEVDKKVKSSKVSVLQN